MRRAARRWRRAGCAPSTGSEFWSPMIDEGLAAEAAGACPRRRGCSRASAESGSRSRSGSRRDCAGRCDLRGRRRPAAWDGWRAGAASSRRCAPARPSGSSRTAAAPRAPRPNTSRRRRRRRIVGQQRARHVAPQELAEGAHARRARSETATAAPCRTGRGIRRSPAHRRRRRPCRRCRGRSPEGTPVFDCGEERVFETGCGACAVLRTRRGS